MTQDTGWTLPQRCEECPDRRDTECRRFNRPVHIAWRMIDGCDITNRRAKREQAKDNEHATS
jgi:hypothetical protein